MIRAAIGYVGAAVVNDAGSYQLVVQLEQVQGRGVTW